MQYTLFLLFFILNILIEIYQVTTVPNTIVPTDSNGLRIAWYLHTSSKSNDDSDPVLCWKTSQETSQTHNPIILMVKGFLNSLVMIQLKCKIQMNSCNVSFMSFISHLRSEHSPNSRYSQLMDTHSSMLACFGIKENRKPQNRRPYWKSGIFSFKS